MPVSRPALVDSLSVHNRRLFLGCLALVEIIGFLAVALTIHWVNGFKGGLPTPAKGIHFNWHPILMTVSLIFLYGNGALIYRVIPPRGESHKLKLKIGHAVIMMAVFVIMVIGLQAAFDSHNNKMTDGKPTPIPNLYTLHSWVGLTAALLFAGQWILGFSAFLFPKFSPDIRSVLLPFHQYFGSAILILSVAAALLGHLEKMIWSNMAGYKARDAEAYLVNFTGMLLILFCLGVTFLLSKFSKEHKSGMSE